MRKKGTILALVMAVIMLVGCGGAGATPINLTPDQMESFADKNGGVYGDVTKDFAGYDQIEGVYVLEVDGAHIELWDITSTSQAAAWFLDNVQTVKKGASSHSGSHTGTGGDYSLVKDGVFYRIIFSEDKGIYAHGEQDRVNGALSGLLK